METYSFIVFLTVYKVKHFQQDLPMKRYILPDLLKGLAAFFMVQIHITELFLDTAGRESTSGKISLFLGGPFAAVVFMAVMGYFIALSKATTSVNIVRGIKIFMLGFLLNIGLNIHFLLKILFADWPYNPLEYMFGVDILYLAGLSIVVLSIIKSLKKWQKVAAWIVFLAVSVLTGFLNEKLTVTTHYYVLPFIAGNYSWSYFPLFPWLAYPLAGFIFARYDGKIIPFFLKQKRILISVTILVAAAVGLFYKQGLSTTINLPAYYHHTFGYVFWALGLTVLWTLFLHVFITYIPETRIRTLLCRIGKNITAFYVIQWLIIGNLATAIYQTQQLSTFPWWVAGIFTVSVLLTFGYEKVLSGLRRQRK